MSAKPNIVFMLGDNVGWGDLSCYGGLVPTPRLDKLASEGIRFTNFNTEAQCTPTRGALLTGRTPIRTGTFRVPLPGESGVAIHGESLRLKTFPEHCFHLPDGA